MNNKYRLKWNGGHPRFVHKVIAEQALGKPLPPGAIVHHADCNPRNNANSNLVICPSDAYHLLLHQRIRAMEASGDPNKRKCQFCKQYDDPANLSINSAVSHKACAAEYARAAYARRRKDVRRP